MAAKLMRHLVFDGLRDDIMSCHFSPGRELRENELAQKYGISKSPIRDALQKLEFEGLVEIVPRQGHRVVSISVKDAQDILEMREILEMAAIKRIAAEASQTALNKLDHFRFAEMTSLRAFARYNRDFHHHLVDLAGNNRLSGSMQRIMDNYERLCIVSLSSPRSESVAMAAALQDHINIIDALQAREGSKAARLSVKHVRRSRRQIMRGLGKNQLSGKDLKPT
ncbi:MAG: GntR family transcriptional regulator [Paracoccaceae bacterium]|jgi:DNA-binding GntR family transcriptional regulator